VDSLTSAGTKTRAPQKFLGKYHGRYSIDLRGHVCEVISLRPATGHPQLVGTDRHITMGGVELHDEKWDALKRQLTLKVTLVRDYPVTFTIYKASRGFKIARASGVDVRVTLDGETLQARLTSSKSGDSVVVFEFD
jgi:hypothetical protein